LLIISRYIHILYIAKKEISFVTATHKFLLNDSSQRRPDDGL